MVLTYSGKSGPSARAIADESDEIYTVRRSRGDVNWGRERANTVLNPDISNATNKRVMRELFASHDVPMPRLCRLHGYEALYPIVGRPDRHSRGRGFWLCNSEAEVRRAFRGTRKKRAATHFMEYIKADREYRVHIFKGKSIRISEKNFQDGKYTTAKPEMPVRRIRQAAKRAVAALGLDFGAVDILANDSGEVFVLEVNAAPGLGGSMPALWAKTFLDWYKDGDGHEVRRTIY